MWGDKPIYPYYNDDNDYNTNAPSFYDYLAKNRHLLKELVNKIWEYDKELAKRFEEWDGQIESLPDNVKNLLIYWLNNGVLEQIINDDVLGNKADKSELDLTNALLAQKPSRNETGWATLGILTEEERSKLLGLQPGELNAVLGNGNVIEQNIADGAVTARKIEYLQQGLNLFDKSKRVEGVAINEVGGETINTLYDSSDFIPVQVGTYTVGPARFVALYDKDKNPLERTDISPETQRTFKVTEDGFVRFSFLNRLNGADKTMLVRGTSLPSEYQPYYFEMKEPIKITDKNIKSKLTENVMNFLSSRNLFNKDRITKKAVLEVTNGIVSTGTDFSDTYAVSYFIPIKHGTVEMTKVRNYVLYDKDKNYLLGVDAPEEETVEIEQDGFIRFTLWTRDIDHTMLTNNEPLGEYQEYGRYYLDPKILVTSDNLQSKDEKDVVSIHFGDSITGNGNLVERISERTGYTSYNFAVGGTRLVDITSIANDYQYMNFLDLLRAKVSGDWTTIDNALSRLNDVDLTKRINTFKSFNMDNVKYISFMYGTNDIVTPTLAIGEKDSEDSLTINGALNEVFNTLFTNWPHVKVFVLSPIIRGSLPNFVGTSDTYERNGVTIFDYVNTMEAKSKEYKVPFKNMLQESGINALNFNTFLADGVHPNSLGEDLVAEVYARFMMTH